MECQCWLPPGNRSLATPSNMRASIWSNYNCPCPIQRKLGNSSTNAKTDLDQARADSPPGLFNGMGGLRITTSGLRPDRRSAICLMVDMRAADGRWRGRVLGASEAPAPLEVCVIPVHTGLNTPRVDRSRLGHTRLLLGEHHVSNSCPEVFSPIDDIAPQKTAPSPPTPKDRHDAGKTWCPVELWFAAVRSAALPSKSQSFETEAGTLLNGLRIQPASTEANRDLIP